MPLPVTLALPFHGDPYVPPPDADLHVDARHTRYEHNIHTNRIQELVSVRDTADKLLFDIEGAT